MQFLKSKFRSLTAWMFMILLFSFTPANKKVFSPEPGWPSVTRETKPWCRWWWMGSGVSPAGLKTAMEAYAGAGLGGLEITPVYGARGYEDRFISFLSPEWTEMFRYTLQEGRRLGLGIDLAMASGWPFGGPWVSPADACKTMEFRTFNLKKGERLKEKVSATQEPLMRSVTGKKPAFEQLKYPISANSDSLQTWAFDQVRYPLPMPLQVLMAYAETGEILDLTSRVSADGTLDWTAPSSSWKLIALFEGWHGKMVERAGPGGEGDVIDHFSSRAIDRMLEFAALSGEPVFDRGLQCIRRVDGQTTTCFIANRGADGLFTTLRWSAQPSGLEGPVTLQPMKKLLSAKIF